MIIQLVSRASHHILPIRTDGGLVFYFLGIFFSKYQWFYCFATKRNNLSYFEIVQPNLCAHNSFLCLSQSHRVLLPFVAAFPPPCFLGYFSSFDELNAEEKAVTLSQEWLLFACFSIKYEFLSRFWPYLVALGLRMFACAAARRAIGTRKGEQDT